MNAADIREHISVAAERDESPAAQVDGPFGATLCAGERYYSDRKGDEEDATGSFGHCCGALTVRRSLSVLIYGQVAQSRKRRAHERQYLSSH